MHFFKQTIRDTSLEGQTVLVRADYNVPLKDDGTIADDFRIKSSLPTLRFLLNLGCKVVVISHLGRPNGKRNKSYSLEVVRDRLAELIDEDVVFVDDCIGDGVYQAVRRARRGSVVLLENLRYYPEEEADSLDFAKKITKASQARFFVQDGFGVVHRAHASTHSITLCLPSVAGLLLESEYTEITKAIHDPIPPFVVVMGGAKVSDKIDIIKSIIPVADRILVGGAMANTFLSHRGIAMGKSMVEHGQAETIEEIYSLARKKVGESAVDDFIVLPTDVAVSTELKNNARRVVPVDRISPEDMAIDIGDETIEVMAAHVASAQTVVWNGPIGMTTLPEYAHGSARIALTLATHPEITSVIGGGDSVDFILGWDARGGDSFTHVSTGGGAGLELMAGRRLPGIESLLDARP